MVYLIFKISSMVKVYFDWNVLSQMKNGHHSELLSYIECDNKFLIPYSTAHIGDISSSFSNTAENKYINSDLEFISRISKNYCLYNNGKGIIIDYYPAKELFENQMRDKELFNNISFDGIMNLFEGDDEVNKLMKPIIESFGNLDLSLGINYSDLTPEQLKEFEILFPGYKDNLTMKGWFDSFGKMMTNFNESDSYKDARQIVQKHAGINRNKIYNTNDPNECIQKMYEKLGYAPDHFNPESKHSPKWFNDIMNKYLLLDMHGYQEDKVNVKKGRKETFRNTTNDAFHAAFASSCNFYIINDKKSYKKTKKVYEELGINTLVLNPNEFSEYYEKYLSSSNSELDLRIFIDQISTGHFYESKSDDGILKTCFLPFFLFGFFNKIMIFYPNDPTRKELLLLSQNKPTNSFLLSMEVRRLIDQLLEGFGEDYNSKGKLQKGEFSLEQWDGRIWVLDGLTLRLQGTNGHVQLYLDYTKESNE